MGESTVEPTAGDSLNGSPAKLSKLLQRRHGRAPLALNFTLKRTKVASVDAELFASMADPVICEEVDGAFYDIERIGEGGSGVVYKAIQRSNDQQVALKVVRAYDDEMVAIGKAEFVLMQRLKHPNIVSALDFLVVRHRTVLVMNFCCGLELGRAVSRTHRKRLPERRAHSLFKALLLALEHLHSQCIVHRDVKPENIMVADDLSTLHLIDFDFARHLPEGLALTPRCTPAYAPPEVYNGGPPTEFADIWGAGLCLLMMLSGQCIVVEGTVDTSSCVASEACTSVLHSCLSSDPLKRPSSQSLLQMQWVTAEDTEISSDDTFFEDIARCKLAASSCSPRSTCSPRSSCMSGSVASNLEGGATCVSSPSLDTSFADTEAADTAFA